MFLYTYGQVALDKFSPLINAKKKENSSLELLTLYLSIIIFLTSRTFKCDKNSKNIRNVCFSLQHCSQSILGYQLEQLLMQSNPTSWPIE